MVVDNKAGASGNLGTDAIAKAPPDGSTIGVSIAGPLGVNALLFKKMPYDAAKDLELVSIAATQPSVLVVPVTLGVSSTDELVALMKKNPGKYNYASMGAGSISHLAMESLASKSGTSVVHVPYAGSGPAVTALLGGQRRHRGAAGGGGHAAHQGRQDQGARGGDGEAIGGVARAADARRKRPQGHPGRRLDGLRRAGEDARCDHQEAARRAGRRSSPTPRCARSSSCSTWTSSPTRPRSPRLAGRRHRALAADHPEEQHHPGLT